MQKPILWLTLLVIAVQAGASEIVTVTLGPDPRIRQHIASIHGPEKSITVLVTRSGSAQTKELQVEVQGPIVEDDVRRVVQSVLALDRGFWEGAGSWYVSIVGDGRYAAVTVSMFCGELCGAGGTFTYTYTEGRWTYLYSSDEWIS